MAFTSLVLTSSPESVVKDSLKKYFNKKVPNSVCTYLLLATLLTVETSKEVFSAMSFKIMGFNLVVSPVIKNAS